MSDDKESYKQIFKATSIFGGVQVFNILIAVLKSKAIAILLGATGMGLVSLFTSTIGLVISVTNFGLGTSAVKNVAAHTGASHVEKMARTVAIVIRLVQITGALGFIITLIFSPWLSELAFGNRSYTIPFMLISVSLFFTQVSAGHSVVLQGMRRISDMAKASMFGALSGFIISIPLYYFLGNEGIVPAIVLSSISLFLTTWYFIRSIKLPKAIVPIDVFKAESKEMLQMGFLFSVSNLISVGAAYIVRIYINNTGGLEDVGLYTAGFAIISTYVGMVFTAMSADYYPRLAEVAQDNGKCTQAINQQAEISILILAPILAVFVVFVQWGVILLYSKEFLGVVSMIQWAALGIFFKALSWSIAIVFLAKSASKAFFWNELMANIFVLLFNIAGYHYFGLTGLGISFLLAYLFYFLQVLAVCGTMYGFRLEHSLIRIFLIQFSIAVLCFLTVNIFDALIASLIGALLIAASAFYSYHELNKRLGIKQFIQNKIQNRKNI